MTLYVPQKWNIFWNKYANFICGSHLQVFSIVLFKIFKSFCYILAFILIYSFSFNVTAYSFKLPQQTLEYEKSHFGNDAVTRLIAWQNLINSGTNKTDLEKIQLVSDFFNAFYFRRDAEVWGQPQFWANPLELLGKKAGDGEDFVIAKYMTLKAMGIPSQKLRMVYVASTKLDGPHMVLAYYANQHIEPLILDNMSPQISPASLRTDLRPIYIFSEYSLWIPQPDSAPKLALTGVRIHGLQALINRMNKEGLTEDSLTPPTSGGM